MTEGLIVQPSLEQGTLPSCTDFKQEFGAIRWEDGGCKHPQYSLDLTVCTGSVPTIDHQTQRLKRSPTGITQSKDLDANR